MSKCVICNTVNLI
ncbi:MAG: hypothetical protein EOO20_20500 [Chryseobacterium sp.]|nr:MAG: hypothetical protein EOO20_20500 [Chryseobacterium sp.]